MKLIKDMYAGALMLSSLKTFHPEKEFRNKRVAIVGAADSAFEEKNGKFIDEHDVVVRINKAPYSWTLEKAEYIGAKFTHLYHSFYENKYSGGGPIEWEYYDRLGIEKVINPICTRKGLQAHLNYYKRHHSSRATYLLSHKNYQNLSGKLENYVPTVGFSALMSVLQADCKEIYITGFTFFRTPYAKGYRDHFLEKEVNQEHIKKQGLHNPDLEFEIFKHSFKRNSFKSITFDRPLQKLVSF